MKSLMPWQFADGVFQLVNLHATVRKHLPRNSAATQYTTNMAAQLNDVTVTPCILLCNITILYYNVMPL